MASPDATNMLATQLTAGAACAYILQLLQKWSKTPWITEHTTGINNAVRLILAFVSSLGISWVWSGSQDGGHTLTIAIPSAIAVVQSLWHVFGQFALQHGWGKVLALNGSVPKEPVTKPEQTQAAAGGNG